MIFKNKRLLCIFFLIFFLGFIFRTFNINWDNGFHLHPDERAIVMDALPLQIPQTLQQFMSPTSYWNPHFFAYGSFPIYLLKLVSLAAGTLNANLTGYDGSNLDGRLLSGLFDLGTLVCVYLLGKKLKNQKVGLIAAFFYSISVLPIQLSHFYAVDTILTFFLIATLLTLVYFYERPSFKKAVAIGMLLGFGFATKISATVILISLSATLTADFGLLILKHPFHPQHWIRHIPRFVFSLIKDLCIFTIVGVVTYAALEPYAFLDFPQFAQQTLAQSQMTRDAFTFPYTLQYVGIVPYWYELKNIFLWGLGPVLATISFLGIIYGTITAVTKHTKQEKWAQELILLVFFWAYFLTVGKFAVAFMRYMLPLYPLLCLFGAIFAYKFITLIKRKLGYWYLLVVLVFICSILYWPLSFMHIYMQPNTRIQASQWIYNYIPHDKTLAVEHWDDQLPIGGSPYNTLTLALYEPDTQEKWTAIIGQLQQADFIIIASNRLYVPIQKLDDCQKYPFPHCYPMASVYYKNLFSGKPILQNTQFANLPGANNLVFKEIKEFTVFPEIPFLNIPINDQHADESFTVYDHPKILIYKHEVKN